MFNKLKVKVAEEVKNSHQRLQQFTQSFTEKVENAASEENFFTIGDDDGQTSSSNTESGFSNVPLTNYSSPPNSGHVRRSSNTSIASDISFLPYYESPTNLYHMQSDLDISASEVEDNASTSSQLGHLSKEQIYSAFQKAQLRYHKYRGRYTDVARHYKDLERENNKIRSVLVETQDKALRRISELREQCSLEQKAKAHLENSLRVELDEKQYIIDSLKTKVDLLQSHKNTEADKINLTETISEHEGQNSNTEVLAKELKEAKLEIEALNAKVQELKANSIISNSKEADFRKKIAELEEIQKQKDVELSEVLERERENNLIIAQTKMELHSEIQSRDSQIENLKHDNDILKSDLDNYKIKLKETHSNKLENFQSQNSKLIEKVEELTQRCNNYESDLLKIQQFKIENQNLQMSVETSKNLIDEYEKSIKIKEDLLQQQKLEYENELALLRDNTKQSLLTLESKIKTKLQDDFSAKEDALTSAFQDKIQLLTETDNTKETQLKLLDQVAETKNLEKKQKELEDIIDTEKEHYRTLETNHLDLIAECTVIRSELANLQKQNQELIDEIQRLKNQNNEMESILLASKQESSALYNEKTNLKYEIETIQNSNVDLQNEITKIRLDVENLNQSNAELEKENAIMRHNNSSDNLATKLKVIISDLQTNVHQLQEEKSTLEVKLELLQKENFELHNKIESLDVTTSEVVKLNHTVTELSGQCSKLQEELKDTLWNSEKYKVEIENSLTLQNKLNSENQGLQNLLTETQKKLEETENQKLHVQETLKEEKHKFHEEIQNLSTEISKFKEQNQKIQGHIDQYKSKLAKYETQSADTMSQLQSLANENLKLKDEISQLKDLLETADSINSNLTKELNNLTQDNNQILACEELINKHIEEQTASLADKIKMITESNLMIKEKNLQQENEHHNLNIQLKEVLCENERLKEQIVQIDQESASKLKNFEGIKLQVINSEHQCKKLSGEIDLLNQDLTRHKNELSNLQNIGKDYQILQNEKVQLLNELSNIQATIDKVNSENHKLSEEVLELKENVKDYSNKLNEYQDIKVENARALEEVTELTHRNNELSLDYKQVTAENEEIVTELAETKLKLEMAFTEKGKNEEIAKKIEIEKAELLNELKQYRNELDKLKMNSLEMENIQEIENLINDNRNLKLLQSQLEGRCESYEKQQKVLEGQLRELEHQYTEISHEKQLLQDEIQELKISPINIVDSQKINNSDVMHIDKLTLLERPNEITAIVDTHQKEIDDLNEKLVQYKSLDLTNRSSLQFYENELQKLRNKNEKLNRKLDETLVTLNHCTELSHSTETEYLKNVLYNYMLGKESLILARVIAAVCKFDETQTNTILQKEQQKQTLLGQLGLL